MSEEEKSSAVESAPEKSPGLESLAKTAEVQEERDKNGDEQKIESDSEKSPAIDDPVNKLTVEAPNEMAPSVNDTKTDVKEDGSSELIQEDESKVDPALVESLTEGFLSKILPNLQTSKAMLEELMRNQQVLIETVQQENTKFNDCDSFQKLEETMKKAKIYHTKLLTLRKDMNSLHEKSARLKKRAVKLQQNKQKEELHRAHKRDKEVEREKMLVAKPAPRRQDTPAAVIDKSVIPEPSYSQS